MECHTSPRHAGKTLREHGCDLIASHIVQTIRAERLEDAEPVIFVTCRPRCYDVSRNVALGCAVLYAESSLPEEDKNVDAVASSFSGVAALQQGEGARSWAKQPRA